jgi:Family of unknown function (DUF5343)
MAKDLFYLSSYKNVGALFEKIAAAKAPDAFTQRYLADTLGLKSVGDRALINMLKKLGFLDGSGRPTNQYGLLKNKETAPRALAKGLREAYKPLFDANETANDLNMDQLKGLVSQVSGAEQKTSALIAYTFNAIAKNADFKLSPSTESENEEEGESAESAGNETATFKKTGLCDKSPFRSDFHFNIQIHLPANGTEETYLNIFAALRRTFT